MAAANPVNFTIVKHETGFDDDGCFLCGELDVYEEKAPLPAQGGDLHLPDGRYVHVEVLSGSVKKLNDRELVHLSCHPNQAYHFKCLRDWLARNSFCPFDRNQVNPSSPRVQVPARLSDTGRKTQNIAQNMLGFWNVFGNVNLR